MVSNVSDDARSTHRRAPVIGLTTYLEQAKQGVWDVQAAFLPHVYFDAVSASGGVAVLLPPQPNPELAASVVLDGLDGLILTGGKDVQPELYGAERHPLTDDPRPDRDDWELALFRGADERRIPVLAICRGFQLVNVARGGTLHQHLPEHSGTADHLPVPGTFGRVPVTVAADSRLAEAVGSRVEVHCHHHQAIDRLGDDVRAVAWAADGTVEGIELTGDVFAVGVQWHPEEDGMDRRLFAALVGEAGT